MVNLACKNIESINYDIDSVIIVPRQTWLNGVYLVTLKEGSYSCNSQCVA